MEGEFKWSKVLGLYTSLCCSFFLSLNVSWASEEINTTSNEAVPDSPKTVSSLLEGETYYLEWDPVPNATRYEVQAYIFEQWFTKADSLTQNFFTTHAPHPDAEIKVLACNQNGCSDRQAVTHIVRNSLSLRFFSSAYSGIYADQSIALEWHIEGASRVTITSDQGHNFDYLPLEGAMDVNLSDTTRFTLSAHRFKEDSRTSVIDVVVFEQNGSGQEGGYLEPLVNEEIEPIPRTFLASSNRLVYFADKNKQIHSFDEEGERLWSRSLSGMVLNNPVLFADNITGSDSLYFTVVNTDGSGYLCHVRTDNTNFYCSSLDQPSTTSPILINDFIYVVSTNAEIRSFNREDLSFHRLYRQHSNEVTVGGGQVLTNAVWNDLLQVMIIRTSQNELFQIGLGGDIPFSENEGESYINWNEQLSN